jgi:hypothetical protein
MAKRVYFAFHYQDVIDFRANVVRKHNFAEGVESAGYFDHSMWEESRKKGAEALKRMINGELEGTSVTAILIGSETYARRWVLYEIVKSVERGNRVIGIHIKGKDQKTKPLGQNPFDYVGLEFSTIGTTVQPITWDGSRWVFYSDLGSWTVKQLPAHERGKRFQLSHWLRTYDWIADDGYNNFGYWVE